MTDEERWDLRRSVLQRKRDELSREIAAGDAAEAERKIRAVLIRLGTDESLPVLDLIEKALGAVTISEADRAAQFIARLTVLVDAGRPNAG